VEDEGVSEDQIFLCHAGHTRDGHESPQMSLYYAHITNGDAVERQKTNSVVDRQFKRAR
jgi:hypothetical protein